MMLIMTKISLGQYVKRLREERHWSQRDLEEQTRLQGYKLDQGTISKIEKDETLNPGIKAFKGLSKALNVHIMKLILAYEGEDPDQASDKELDEDLREALAIKKALDEVRKKGGS